MANGGPNLDLAMRIGLELDDAVQQAAKLDATLDKVQDAGKNAATGLDAAASAANRETQAVNASTTAANAKVAANTKLKASEDAAGAAMARTGNSAKQQAMAMRQLPMQITDITVGLASGQSPFMVAIQQGGQLKDSFGGVGAASRALLGALSPTLIAVGAAGGAFIALGAAAFQGYQEIQAYEGALISTGNISGQTAGQIMSLANNVGEASGEFKDAESAALQLARSGKVAADTMEAATSAAVNLSKLTGESIEETTDKIIKLADSPSAMLVKLNEQYHFLSLEVLDHVKTLEDQGRAQEAVQAAVENFANVHEQRVKEAEERAGWLEQAWRGLGRTIAGVWDSLKDIGRNDVEHRLDVAESVLANMRGNPRMQVALKDQEQLVESLRAEKNAAAEAASAQADRQRVQDEGIKAQQAVNKTLEQGASKSDQLRQKTTELKEQFQAMRRAAEAGDAGAISTLRGVSFGARGTISGGAFSEAMKALEAKYTERTPATPKARKARDVTTDAERAEQAAQRELENLTKQAALLDLVEEGEKRVSEEARVRYEIENGAYQASSASAKQQLLDAAKVLDIKREERDAEEKKRQEIEKTTKAYEQLQDTLRTPVEAAVDTVLDQIKVLNDALDADKVKAENYNSELAKIGAKALTPLPDYREELYQYGIGNPEADRMADAQAELQAQYAQRLAIINAALQQENSDTAYWHAQSVQLEEQHQSALTNLAIAENQMRMTQISGAFQSMAQIAGAFAGEQSKTYQAMFALSKGFAVAAALIAVYQNAAEASKQAGGYPYNIPIIAGAIAQGLGIIAQLKSVQPGGYATGGRIHGPGSGTSDDVPIWASAGEFMVRYAAANQPGAGPFLEDFNRRGMAALDDWRGYAAGGPISADPVYSRNEGGYQPQAPSSSANVLNRMRVYLAQDADHLMQMIANHPHTEKMVVGIAGQNGNAIRAEW